jgi:CRISPR-associated protein Cas2
MIVLHLTDCPPGLKGDLTKWLFEIASGVYVGQVSARVRDKLWLRIRETCRHGRVVMVYNCGNREQRIDFLVHGDTWEPMDFDGIKLMLRPSAPRSRVQELGDASKNVRSNASKGRLAKRFTAHTPYPRDYVVVDVETTGLDPDSDEIIEIGAIKVLNSEKNDTFHCLISTDVQISSEITSLTGITSDEIAMSGQPLNDALGKFLEFHDELPIVGHNLDFDRSFLDAACVKCNLSLLSNRWVDTIKLARRLVKNLGSYRLASLAEHFNLSSSGNDESSLHRPHRSLGDCETTHSVYQKLMNLNNPRS